MEQHLEMLKRRHSEVDNAVQQELKRPLPDTLAMRTLKKMRLRLKDEITRLKRHMREDLRVGNHLSQSSRLNISR